MYQKGKNQGMQESPENTTIVFVGSPPFAVPILEAIDGKYQVAAAVTQPDKPAGRGKKMEACAVKKYAVSRGIPVLEPVRLRREPERIEELKQFKADLFVIAAYGQILPQSVLDIPKYGCINVHASLLPRWRGASPIQAAILYGDHESGVTIMKMDAGMDTGPILRQTSVPLVSDENEKSLSEKLRVLGRDLLMEVIPEYLAGTITITPQDDEAATYAPLIKKEDGKLDVEQPVELLERKVRALNPWPGTFLEWNGKQLKVHEVEVISPRMQDVGVRGIHERYPVVQCVGGGLLLKKVQVPGKKMISGRDFLNGVHDWVNGGA